jgi:hypothetical protein
VTIRSDIAEAGLMLFDGQPLSGHPGKSLILTDGEHFEIVEFDPDKEDEEATLADMLARFRQQLN